MIRVAGVVLVLSLLAAGQEKTGERAKEEGKRKPQGESVAEKVSVTRHEAVIGGRRIRYSATTAYMPMKTEKGELTANLFYIAYTKQGVADVSKRPVTFVFNGGPGSSSVWLHLGTIGPRRVVMSDEGRPLRPPGRLVDCDESWLDLSDLVFIDPIGTGFSRPAEEHKQSEFSGLKEDTRSVGDFIRLYTTRARRWSSPKYLAGESYGTTRAASLSGYLQDRYGMYLNGIVLISAVLDFQTLRSNVGNDLPYVLFLPALTATAWYHRKLDEELQKDLRRTVEEANAFALGEYLLALAQGDLLPEADRLSIAKRVARYTGLSEEFVLAANLRVSQGRFCKELLRDRRRTVGRLDSRFLGIDRDAAGSRYEYDPAMAAIDGPFSSALKDYVRGALRFESDIAYETLSGRVRPWKSPEGRYVNVAETLRAAITKNRNLKVLVCSGYYDLATPFSASDYTVHHLGLEPELRGNVTVRYYESGHMMYIHAPSRRKLKADVAAFYGAGPSSKPAEAAGATSER